MKKIISIFLMLAALSALAVPAFASECRHSYLSVLCPADCQSPERTVYTCEHCGDTYTKYAWEYNEPNGFGLVFDTERDDENSTLTLTVTMLNNPGLLIAIMNVSYNADVLTPVKFTNGEVWDDADYPFNVNITKNPVKVYSEKPGTESNFNSGLYYTLTFSIIDPNGDYGLGYYIIEKNFVNWDNRFFKPQVIDLTGKRELGSHVPETVTVSATCTDDGYTQQVCKVCETVLSSEILPSTGHSYGENFVEEESVGTVSHGHFVKICAGCGDRIETVLPFKGDINDDGKRNAIDSNIMKQYVMGEIPISEETLRYAVDLNADGKINAVDMNILKGIILGDY